MSHSTAHLRSHSFIVSRRATSLAPVVRTSFLEEVALNTGWVLDVLKEEEAPGRAPSLL